MSFFMKKSSSNYSIASQNSPSSIYEHQQATTSMLNVQSASSSWKRLTRPLSTYSYDISVINDAMPKSTSASSLARYMNRSGSLSLGRGNGRSSWRKSKTAPKLELNISNDGDMFDDLKFYPSPAPSPTPSTNSSNYTTATLITDDSDDECYSTPSSVKSPTLLRFNKCSTDSLRTCDPRQTQAPALSPNDSVKCLWISETIEEVGIDFDDDDDSTLCYSSLKPRLALAL